jgi:hypothetical protein
MPKLTKEEFIAKYYKKNLPGADGKFSIVHLQKNWKKDNGQKPSKKEFDDLMIELNG